jgi:probable F420-dependent oxidoreductase
MRLGVSIPKGGTNYDSELREFISAADDLGFDSIWMGDHVVIPAQYDAEYPYRFRFAPDLRELFPDSTFPECLTTLSFVAGCSPRLRIGTGVLIVPMRNPVLTAKALATLSVLTGGRFIAGIGVGWLSEEFEALAQPFERRGARTDEFAEIMQRLWADPDPVAYEGEFYNFSPIRFEPKPVGNRVPIWIGGHTDAALERVARYGDGWYAVELDPADMARLKAKLMDMWQKAGRSGVPEIALARRLHLTEPDISPAVRLMTEYQDVGVDLLVSYSTVSRSFRTNMERAEKLARQALPELAGASRS